MICFRRTQQFPRPGSSGLRASQCQRRLRVPPTVNDAPGTAGTAVLRGRDRTSGRGWASLVPAARPVILCRLEIL